MASLQNLRTPDALKLTGGNVADNWKRFKEQFANYELAADLSDASQEKRAAVFLTCIGKDAYDVYRSMEFESDDERRKLDSMIAAFEQICCSFLYRKRDLTVLVNSLVGVARAQHASVLYLINGILLLTLQCHAWLRVLNWINFLYTLVQWLRVLGGRSLALTATNCNILHSNYDKLAPPL